MQTATTTSITGDGISIGPINVGDILTDFATVTTSWTPIENYYTTTGVTFDGSEWVSRATSDDIYRQAFHAFDKYHGVMLDDEACNLELSDELKEFLDNL